MDAPSFSHFRLPAHAHAHSQSCSAVAVSDIPLETGLPRCVLRGSLDPTTGIFYRASEHTRLRTAQACDKCRARKAKCSGDHPICKRCLIRGLTCHYGPERRTRQWSKAKAEQGAVPDRSTSRPGAVPPSSAALQLGRPRSKSGTTFTSHGPSSRHADADRPGSGDGGEKWNENSRRTGGTAPRPRPRRATIASAVVRSSSSSSSSNEGAVQSGPSFLQQVLDLRRDGSDRPRDHPVSGSRCAVPVGVGVTHEALETTESMICEGDGKAMVEGQLGIDTPRIEENALTVYLDPYTGSSHTLFDSILTPEATGDDMSRATLSDHIHLDLTGAEYPEGVDDAQHPMLFHHPPRFHWSGPGSGSCFDMSLVDLGMISNDERPSFCATNDVESPGLTPSTSSSASPDLTRASSDGLPTTPTNSYPNSPYTLPSLSPHLGPFVGDSNAYPLFTSGVQTTETETDGQDYHYPSDGGTSTEYVGWCEVKDSAHSFGGSLSLFFDMDPVF